jgi:hypothetical protein
MKRYRIGTSEDKLYTQVQDRKTDTTASISNFDDAWREIPKLFPALFPKGPRYVMCNLVRMGWYQRIHRLLP